LNGIISAVKVMTLLRKKQKTCNMPRGDNNKSGSSGRGASNQSNQPFGQAADEGKSNTNKNANPGKASQPKPKQRDQSADRNTSTDGEKKRR
jgi:hypothetical protein